MILREMIKRAQLFTLCQTKNKKTKNCEDLTGQRNQVKVLVSEKSKQILGLVCELVKEKNDLFVQAFHPWYL